MSNPINRVIVFLTVFVLLITTVVPTLAAPTAQTNQDIVDIAIADGRFTTLVTALQGAELVDTLRGDGPFTVFAPTDDAFAKLPAGALDDLLANPAELKNVLLYHVVPGKVMAADVVTLNSADTVLGQPVTIMTTGNTVKINDAQVIITDIEASNGVIHVIDTVIMPPSAAPAAAPMAETPAVLPQTGGEFTFPGYGLVALVALGLVFLTGGLAVGLKTVRNR